MTAEERMGKFKLSVAMCTFNGSRFLRDQLDSIAAQTRLPDEVVICDDGSTDSTIHILDTFRRNAPFPVRLHIHERSVGSTKNFATAIELCGGGIIVLSDQDDVWRSDRLEATETAFRSNPKAGAFFSDADIVDASLNPLGYRLWHVVRFGPRERACLARGDGVSLLLRRNVVTGATLAIESKFRKLILPIPEGWLHDAWAALLIAVVAELVFCEQPLIQYRQHSRNQIGGVRRSFGEQLEMAMPSHAEIYAAAAANFAAARERLLTTAGVPLASHIIRALDAKIEHMQIRASLPHSRILRLPAIVSELAAGRYHCYSNAWKSVVRDLWF